MSSSQSPLAKPVAKSVFATAGGLALFRIETAWAALEKTVTHPDGSSETMTVYYPPLAVYLVTSLAVIAGATIAFWGVKIIMAGMDQGQDESPTDVELDLRQRQIRFRKLTQGSMVALFGSTIILGSLYFMTS